MHPTATLRPLRAADMAPWSSYLCMPEVFEHTSWNHPSPGDLAAYLGSEASGDPSTRLRLAIASRRDDRLLGTIGFHTVSAEHRSAELAYDLHPEAWGQGLATSLAGTLVHWAFAEPGLLRVQATVLESNARSVRVLERLGFEREGLLRCYRLVRGKRGDFHMYARLAGS